jgi:hypothetical protein
VADLFDLVDLPSWLQVPSVDTETATRVRRFASGWLMQATGLTSWPTPVPDDLWAYAIELAAIAYNPSGLSSESLDDHNVAYSAERRQEILTAARTSYNTARTTPVGSFPDWDWHWVAVPLPSPLVN